VGPTLFRVGALVIFASVGAFLLACVGPKSDLWWPDRPGRPLPNPGAILKIGIPFGVVLMVVGLLVG